jgi:hypothetical protein
MTMHSIEAEVRSEIKDGYRLKVSVLDLGFYVDGFRAARSDRSPTGWWVQPPATRSKSGKWIQCPEFDKQKTLWQEIEAAVAACVAEYERNKSTDDKLPTKAIPWMNDDD